MLYLYAIIDQPGLASLPGVGIADQPTFCCQDGAIGAIVSRIEPQQLTPDHAQIWCHEAVVEALSEIGGTLPVRFGTLLSDEAAVYALLRERREAFLAGLSQVRGRVELSLRALWFEPPPAPAPVPAPAADLPHSGRAYIERRLAQTRADALQRLRAEQIADDIYARLDRYAVASIRKVLPTER
ncbi:MAG: hypothetical protein HGA65_10355, partial [Oscillochloris sp.]|nr:hypothetical protein [Oscillochloris sp.]